MNKVQSSAVVWTLAGMAILSLGTGLCLAADDCPDAWISTKISTRIAAEIGVGAARINPDTEICVVTMRGCVKSEDHRVKALAIAAKVDKVKKVIDKMTVCEED